MYKQLSKHKDQSQLPLILEIGAFSTKAGYAGEETPFIYEQTVRS